MNKDYTLEKVLKEIDLYFKDEFKSQMKELANENINKMSPEEWKTWVENFIP